VSSEHGPIRILSVDDHPLIRQGVAGLVATQADMNLIAEAANGREAIQQFHRHRPDITLMDLQMPEMSGLDAIIAIRGEFPEARIIVLTTYAGDVQALRALKAGARAYLLKDSLHKELLATIRAVHAGKKNHVPRGLLPACRTCHRRCADPGGSPGLASHCRGECQQRDRGAASTSEDTVKGQVRNILSKLGAKDRTHAAMIGSSAGSSSSDRPKESLESTYWGLPRRAVSP